MEIGFIGLGNMGLAMAMNLLKAGHDLTVYNRNAEKAKPLLKRGAHAAANPTEASGADVVFTMLADDHACFGNLDMWRRIASEWPTT